MTAIEWSSGKSTQPPTVESVLDSDDDDDADPLKVLAQHREVKVVKVIKAEESLITPADLKEIASFAKETDDTVAGNQIELEPHAIYMCGMDAMNMNNNNYTKGKHKFMPHKTTKGNVHDVDKEKARKKGPHWENTAATPPILRNNELSVLTLQESIEIQRQQYDAMKVRFCYSESVSPTNGVILCYFPFCRQSKRKSPVNAWKHGRKSWPTIWNCCHRAAVPKTPAHFSPHSARNGTLKVTQMTKSTVIPKNTTMMKRRRAVSLLCPKIRISFVSFSKWT